jgi:hypothetical protein
MIQRRCVQADDLGVVVPFAEPRASNNCCTSFIVSPTAGSLPCSIALLRSITECPREALTQPYPFPEYTVFRLNGYVAGHAVIFDMGT